ncbi:substrate-binding domain-containing protein [Micromonospora sp. NPDC049559]|uniref:substrate-binding domain-containing protein n=1 Tax=Micromonospora sp. NPDC049559 TaxID=3155923 RepID=UPI00343E7892
MRQTTRRSVVVALGAAALSVALGAGSAQADPGAGITPAATDIVGVGSDTTEFVVQDLVDLWNTTHTPKAYSFHATGTSPITTKSGCASITRPNGSSAGITALLNTAAVGGNDCVDFARSSRAITAAEDATLDAYAFATDGLRIAVPRDNDGAGSDVASNKPASLVLNTANLAILYRCQADIAGSNADFDGVEEWSDLVAGATGTPRPMIPQAGSGTRSFFLQATGLTEADLLTQSEGGCVQEVQEHDATPVNANAGAFAPFSTARFVSTVAPVKTADNGTNKPINLLGDNIPSGDNAAHFSATRQVFNVAKTSKSGTGTNLRAFLNWITTDAGACSVIKSNGFTPVNNIC